MGVRRAAAADADVGDGKTCRSVSSCRRFTALWLQTGTNAFPNDKVL